MSSQFVTLKSSNDRSVNFVKAAEDGGAFESRFVQRSDDYFIVYLSSHTGCNKSCRFCHLTASGQTMMTPATLQVYVEQAKEVFAHYAELIEGGQVPASKVHFNFMARGEALSNPTFTEHTKVLFDALAALAVPFDLDVKFMVSSIIPADFTGDLSLILSDPRSMLYYSIYSVDPAFRKRWLPKSKDVNLALDEIKTFQEKTGNLIAIHWAFIKGQNDTEESVINIMNALNARSINAKFNAVRYNPYDEQRGEESEEVTIEALFKIVTEMTKDQQSVLSSRIVPRVGFDVKASCGMFVSV